MLSRFVIVGNIITPLYNPSAKKFNFTESSTAIDNTSLTWEDKNVGFPPTLFFEPLNSMAILQTSNLTNL